VIPLIVAVFAVLILLGTSVSFLVDLLWYRSVGFSDVFVTRTRLQILLFVVFGALTAVVVGFNIVLAYRLRPPVRPISSKGRITRA